jgi:hypothetical protein
MKRLARAIREYLALPFNKDMICALITLPPIDKASNRSRKCQEDEGVMYPWQRCSACSADRENLTTQEAKESMPRQAGMNIADEEKRKTKMKRNME